MATLETLVDLGRAPGMPLVDFLDGLDVPPPLSHERAQMELRLRELARGLADRDLRLAIALIKAVPNGREECREGQGSIGLAPRCGSLHA